MGSTGRFDSQSKRFRALPWFLLMLVLLLSLSASAFAREQDRSVLANYTQRVYSYANGLTSPQINDVLQTKDGYLWIASYTGLIRFSGDQFVYMGMGDDGEEAFSNIMCLFEDSKNRLWIGTNDRSVIVYKNHRFVPIAQERHFSVTGFVEQADGSMLFATKEGVFHVREEGAYEPYQGFTQGVKAMVLDQRKRLWTVDLYGAISAPEPFNQLVEQGYRYSAVHEDKQGDLWLGTESGQVFVLSKDGEGYKAGRRVDTQLGVVSAFCEDQAGNLWIVTDNGMGRVNAQGEYLVADGSKLSSSLSCMVSDHEGSLWVGSSRGGLLQMIPSVIRDYTFAGNLGNHVINSATIYQGNAYIATDDGLFLMDPKDQLVDNELSQMLKGIRVRCLTEDSLGNLWIAAYSQYGAIRYTKDGQITVFNSSAGLTSDKARMVMERKNGDIVVGTSEGLNVIRGDQVVETYGVQNGLENSIVLCTAEDNAGRLLIGTDGGGIFCLDAGTISPFTVGELNSKVILRLYYDAREDALWIATGTSFYHYNGTLTELAHIAAAVNSVFDIIPMPDGRMCLLATNGIVCGSSEALRTGNSDMVLIQNRGDMPYHMTANSWNRIDQDGNLFLCGTEEVGRFNTELLLNNATPSRLILDYLMVDGTKVHPQPKLDISENTKRIAMNLVSPHFGYEENIMFEYYLEPFESTPQKISANKEREITYTNLRGGNYTFHVRVQNGAGEYSPEQTLVIQKAYHLWERPIVWVFAGIALLLLLFVVVRLAIDYRTRKILQKQEEYRRITNQAILTISNAIDAKDTYTEGHSERVAGYSVELGRRLGMSEDELEHLHYIALLHDIGKIGITDTILNKPDRLTDDEFVIMKSHTSIGGEILKDFVAVPDISEGARAHHEKYNGTGYPNGLKGDEISLIARIIGVCDTYDAMATTRAYRNALDRDYIVGEIQKFSGVQFDPAIAKVMIEMISEGFTVQRKSQQ